MWRNNFLCQYLVLVCDGHVHGKKENSLEGQAFSIHMHVPGLVYETKLIHIAES